MAKQLKDYERPDSGRPPTYPWHLWLDGRLWQLTRGTDFTCQMESMETLIRRTASNYDLKVTISRPDAEREVFVIQAREPEQESDGQETE
jgi:hypothetical protein